MAAKKNLTGKEFNSSTCIVGIGASAGGLEAINELFENMPDNTGFSFVIIQHLSPDHKSLMSELLSRHTVMPTAEAEDGMILKPNCIYLIPNKKFMTVQFGKLHLREKVKNKMPNNAIDIFFESLAKECGANAVGIILSGTGSDGTRGIEAIKKNGGTVVVQDPISAAFDGMPNSAMANGSVDIVAPPDAIAEELFTFLNESPSVRSFYVENQKSEFFLREVLARVRNSTGLDFSHYKRPTLLRRLSKRITELAIHSIQDYIKYLDTHTEEMDILSKEFLINVSSFFRDNEAFETIRTNVIPAIMKGRKPDEPVKVWSVACSTGEEAYSIAILFREYLTKHKLVDFTVKIFATDIDKDALETASRGIYPKSILQDVSGDRVAKYFVPEGNAYRIHPEVRKMVVFSYHDILKDPPFSKMDLICCRNMLIYINPQQQKEILKKLHFALNIDGYLFLGSSENIGIMKNVVEEIDKKWKISKCTAKVRLEDHDNMFSPLERKAIRFTLPSPKAKNPLQHVAELFNETLFEEFKFAGIFINKDFEVKQAIGNYKKFLEFPEGGFNFNLMKLVKQDLAVALSVAIRKAVKDNSRIVVKDVRVRDENEERKVTVIVKPYLLNKDYLQPFLFIILGEEEKKEEKPANYSPVDNVENEARVGDLERELHETRSNLQVVIEEVETANEELQSANEEMISTNEELQSTNEELQSLNEELHTVSAEHQIKIKELTELNDDLNNYFRNSDIGQILVDRKLIIRKFTPAVTRMINLIESDVNRSIIDITTKIKNIDLVKDIRHVLNTEDHIEKEISLTNNNVYLMRISPFIKQDKSVDGAVVNFIDVSEIKKLSGLVQGIFNSSLNGITALKTVRNSNNEIIDFEYTAVNSAAEKIWDQKPGTMTGKKLKEDFAAEGKNYFNLYSRVVKTGEPVHLNYFSEKDKKWYEVVAVKMLDGVVNTFTDITDKKKAADLIAQSFENLKTTSSRLADTNTKLEKSNMDLMQFASVASHDLKEPLRKIEAFGNLLHAKIKGRLENGDINYLDKIIKSSHRMQALIEDVLTLSKLSNEEMQQAKVDLNKTLSRIKDDLEITIDEKNAAINVGALPSVRGVPGEMHQLFQNLLSNALKFNDKKKPVITIADKRISKKISAELQINPENYICISVKDNGIGFEDKFKEKIFGIFQRLNGSQFEGTGIGLAISKKIVENHNGFLFAESKLDEGSEFFVILPR